MKNLCILALIMGITNLKGAAVMQPGYAKTSADSQIETKEKSEKEGKQSQARAITCEADPFFPADFPKELQVLIKQYLIYPLEFATAIYQDMPLSALTPEISKQFNDSQDEYPPYPRFIDLDPGVPPKPEDEKHLKAARQAFPSKLFNDQIVTRNDSGRIIRTAYNEIMMLSPTITCIVDGNDKKTIYIHNSENAAHPKAMIPCQQEILFCGRSAMRIINGTIIVICSRQIIFYAIHSNLMYKKPLIDDRSDDVIEHCEISPTRGTTIIIRIETKKFRTPIQYIFEQAPCGQYELTGRVILPGGYAFIGFKIIDKNNTCFRTNRAAFQINHQAVAALHGCTFETLDILKKFLSNEVFAKTYYNFEPAALKTLCKLPYIIRDQIFKHFRFTNIIDVPPVTTISLTHEQLVDMQKYLPVSLQNYILRNLKINGTRIEFPDSEMESNSFLDSSNTHEQNGRSRKRNKQL